MVSSSCVGASCLLCIPVLSLAGALPQAEILEDQENLSWMSLTVVKARSVLSHPPVTESRSLWPAPPHPLHLPLHLFRLSRHWAFPAPLPVLGQGFLKVITSSHKRVAGGRVVPMLCQPLLKLLPDPAYPCSEDCLHQLGFPVLSIPSSMGLGVPVQLSP